LFTGQQALDRAGHHVLHGLLGVEGGVGGDDHVGEGLQQSQVVVGDGDGLQVGVVQAALLLQHIQGGGPHLPALDGLDEGGGVDQVPPGGVDEDDPVLHFGEALPVDDVVVLRI